MRYEDLFEENSPDLFNHIEKDGMELVENKTVLYRGSENSNETKTVILKTRFDRKPTDTPQVIHDIIDVWFFNKFGIKARSQSIFTTPKLTFAKRYGVPTAILPKGNAVYIYSKKACDLFNNLSERISTYIQDTEFDEINRKYDLDLHENLSIRKIYRYINTKFLDNEIPTELYQWLKNIIDKVMDSMDYVATDTLMPGDADNVEVMVHCNEYYSVGRKSPESYKLEAKYGYLI